MYWVERASWWILSVVALLQILAFSAFVDREIAWTACKKSVLLVKA